MTWTGHTSRVQLQSMVNLIEMLPVNQKEKKNAAKTKTKIVGLDERDPMNSGWDLNLASARE